MTSPIDGPRSARREDEVPKLIPLTRLLGEVQQRFVDRCKKLLERSFFEADEQLHEWNVGARQAPGGDPIAMMEELTQIKAPISDAFASALTQGFHRLVQPEAFSDVPSAGGFGHAKLTVVEGEGFELDRALKELAPKVRAHYAEALDAFIKRLDHLLLQIEVSQKNNPVEPFLVIQSFLRACSSQSGLSKQLKVLLFAQFRAHVLKKLGSCYVDINKVLLEAGILPECVAEQEEHVEDSSHADGEHKEIELPPQAQIQQPVQQIVPRQVPDLTRSLAAKHKPVAATAQVEPGVRPRNLNKLTGRSALRRAPGPRENAPRQNMDHDPRPMSTPGTKLTLTSGSDLSRDEVLAVCAGVFREIQADVLVPTLVKERICQLQETYKRFALTAKPDFLLQPEHPARCLLELLWDLGRSLAHVDFVELQPAFVRIVEVVGEIRSHRLVSDEIFLQAYCKLLTLQ